MDFGFLFECVVKTASGLLKFILNLSDTQKPQTTRVLHKFKKLSLIYYESLYAIGQVIV